MISGSLASQCASTLSFSLHPPLSLFLSLIPYCFSLKSKPTVHPVSLSRWAGRLDWRDLTPQCIFLQLLLSAADPESSCSDKQADWGDAPRSLRYDIISLFAFFLNFFIFNLFYLISLKMICFHSFLYSVVLFLSLLFYSRAFLCSVCVFSICQPRHELVTEIGSRLRPSRLLTG